MESGPVKESARTGASIQLTVGLPSAALATMLGIVYVVNAHRFGWIGIAAGVVLIAGGIYLGIASFRSRES